MPCVTVSRKGWVVIPKALREKYGISPGSKVRFIDLGGTLYLVPVPPDPIRAYRGVLGKRPGQRSMAQILLDERRRDREDEERGVEQVARAR
jgi:AbrB family looped-hinge helix DNA binding protein